MDLRTAVILAGGKGTRLKPYTVSIPKPLMPLDDIPILEVVLNQLAHAGLQRVVITVGYLAQLIEATIGDGSRWNLEVEYSHEDRPLGTAGPLHLIQDLDPHFLVMNGDLLTDVNYLQLFQRHLEAKAWATIAAHKRTVHIDYGVIEIDDKGALKKYIEKPSIPYSVSMGVNILSKESLALVPKNERYDMPQLMSAIVNHGQLVHCFETDCYWQDIGRLDDFDQATQDFTQHRSQFLKPLPR